ncbi:flagellar basal body P-ring protein FlgI [uncultured Rubinisphaera sp.]|uniref:flagellar basal body P-ring protein FlgI n=1 Tax=uncultured Rubinisphaera sp. TaxID=1678686 RepID=UPI0030D807B1
MSEFHHDSSIHHIPDCQNLNSITTSNPEDSAFCAPRIGFIFSLMILVIVCGCSDMNLMMPTMLKKMEFKSAKADEKGDSFEDDFDLDQPKVINPPFLGEYVVVSGLNLVTLEGVGLVSGLDGTGGDPPPSQYRTELLKDMRRRDIEDPNRIISSPSTALVIVRAYLPPLVSPGEKFDVEVRLPDGSETTSLNGGWLLECRLTERAIVAGKGVLEGKARANASGPILVSTGEDTSSSLLKRGHIVGGGMAFENRDMYLFMRNEYRSVRNSTRVAQRIGVRFFSYDSYGKREPLAQAKTDQKLVLQIHPSYKDNFPRYVQVIQNIAFRETEVERQVRLERLEKELLIPEKAEQAALQLEAIGPDAIPMLKNGLTADYFESRFHSAVALAYLGEPAGLETLYIAARDVPAFRVFALTAMTVVEEGETFAYLRQLMDESQLETRYGAFRGMTTIDENEPFARGELLNDQCKLHELKIGGDPMIHLTHRQKAEIVLFGDELKFSTPLALTAGPHIMVNSAPGSNEVVVSKYRIGEPDQRKVVSTNIADVIRTAAEMGASYPDIAQMLVQAERQLNLPGPIGIDMLPEAGRYYQRPDQPDGDAPHQANNKGKKTKVGNSNMTPNPYTKITDENEEEATKPILSMESLEDEVIEDPNATEIEPDAEAAEESEMKSEKTSKEPEPVKRGSNPIKRLKTFMKQDTHGELVYPEQEEE